MSHEHYIVDTGKHFTIDPLLRTITTKTRKLVLSQGDHNSERYTFEIPRIVEGHDMTLCNHIEIHYDNISGNTNEVFEDFYVINDATVNDNTLQFSWLISGNATRLAGNLQFWINFSCTDENNEIIYAWGTDTFKSVRVLENNRNTQAVTATFPDVLEQWKSDIFSDVVGNISDKDIAAALSTYLEKHPITSGTTSTIGTIELLANNWKQVENTENLYCQDVTIAGVSESLDIKKCQVNLTPSVEQLTVFYDKDLTFVTENEDGMVTVFALGQRPENDYTVQVTLTEVDV